MQSKLSISSEEANAALGAAISAAPSKAVSIAVVDDAGGLLSFQRMNGARAYTVELAIQKARSSASVGIPSAVLQAAGHLDVTAGGLPILAEGQCVGAIGVSGAATEEDVRLATAGIAALFPSP